MAYSAADRIIIENDELGRSDDLPSWSMVVASIPFIIIMLIIINPQSWAHMHRLYVPKIAEADSTEHHHHIRARQSLVQYIHSLSNRYDPIMLED